LNDRGNAAMQQDDWVKENISEDQPPYSSKNWHLLVTKK
jgi:hypothetical protein